MASTRAHLPQLRRSHGKRCRPGLRPRRLRRPAHRRGKFRELKVLPDPSGRCLCDGLSASSPPPAGPPAARRVSLSTGNPCRSVASLSPLVPSRTDHFRERRRPRRRLIKGHTAYWLGGLSTIEPLPSDKSSDSHVSRIVLTENQIRKSANTRCSSVISLRVCAVGKRLSPAKETPAVMGCSAQREWLHSCAQRGRLFICSYRHCGNPPKKGDAPSCERDGPWDGSPGPPKLLAVSALREDTG